MPFIRGYSKFLDGLTKVLKVALAALLASMILIMAYQSVMRYVFNDAKAWCEELAIYLHIALVMLSLGIACRLDSHLQVDFLTRLYGAKIKCLVFAVFSAIAIVVMCIFSVYSFRLMGHTVASSITMPIKMKQVYFLFPLGSIIMILYCVEVVARNVVGFLNNGVMPELNNEEKEDTEK